MVPLESLEPVDVTLKVNNDGHQKVREVALPRLKAVMQSPEFCNKTPRDQVRQCLQQVELSGDRIWGAHLWYTRRRTVEDLILKFYFDDVKRLL